MELFQVELERKAKELGSELFGVADLTVAQDFVCNQGGEYLRKFPRAISIGMQLVDPIVDELRRHGNPFAIFTYRAHYTAVNSRLDHIGLLLAKKIQAHGDNAYPIPASQNIDQNRLIGVISHKLAAHLAGLGWIGKSCLLITPNHGPRVRFTTVLTDAPLTAGSPIEARCGDCREWVTICPVKAFTGTSFRPSDPREVRFKAQLCRNYEKKRKATVGEELCGLCVYVCPYGDPASKGQRITPSLKVNT